MLYTTRPKQQSAFVFTTDAKPLHGSMIRARYTVLRPIKLNWTGLDWTLGSSVLGSRPGSLVHKPPNPSPSQ